MQIDRKEVKFWIEVEPERIPVRGNAFCSGDKEADRRVEDEIIARLKSDDVWAWTRKTSRRTGIIRKCVI